MKRVIRKLILGSVIPVGLLVVWHLASAHSVVVPSIGSVAMVLAHPFTEPAELDSASLAAGIALSLTRVAVGFSLAVFTAIPIGLLVGRCRFAREALSPVMAASMAVSPIAWIPVAIIIFGLSSPATMFYGADSWRHDMLDQVRLAIVAVIWMGAFFPMVVNVAAGAAGVRKSYCEAVTVLGAGRRQVLLKVILPGAAPAILTGLRVGAGISWRVIIAAELFPGTRGGLGYMISTSHEVVAYEYAFAGIVVIAAIGLVVDGMLSLAVRRTRRWQVEER